MKCPNCKDISLTMSERSGVEIDYCPECRGVWLDRGELDKILEKAKIEGRQTSSSPQSASQSGSPMQTPYPPHQQQSYDQQQYYKFKRKKSFLEELFD